MPVRRPIRGLPPVVLLDGRCDYNLAALQHTMVLQDTRTLGIDDRVRIRPGTLLKRNHAVVRAGHVRLSDVVANQKAG
jgi:hypothetical protein